MSKMRATIVLTIMMILNKDGGDVRNKRIISPKMDPMIAVVPRKINQLATLRRLGLLTTDSASPVVKPVPVIADKVWKRALRRSIPVSSKRIDPVQ